MAVIVAVKSSSRYLLQRQNQKNQKRNKQNRRQGKAICRRLRTQHYSCDLDLRWDSRAAARWARRQSNHGIRGRTRDRIGSLSGVFFLAVASCWRGTGSWPSSQRRAYQGKHDGASHATTVSRCGRGRARFWRSGKTPRHPAASLHPAGFPDVRAGGTPCGKKAGSPSATVRRPGRPRVQVPAIPGPANSIQAQ